MASAMCWPTNGRVYKWRDDGKCAADLPDVSKRFRRVGHPCRLPRLLGLPIELAFDITAA